MHVSAYIGNHYPQRAPFTSCMQLICRHIYVLTGQVTYRMSKPITAWLSIGSTYSYLTALRINAIQRDMSLNLSVKPISIRAIMKSMDNIPFPPSKKTKVDYMWRDIERRADWYGLPKPKLPAPYPCLLYTSTSPRDPE